MDKKLIYMKTFFGNSQPHENKGAIVMFSTLP